MMILTNTPMVKACAALSKQPNTTSQHGHSKTYLRLSMNVQKNIIRIALLLGALTLAPSVFAQTWESLSADSRHTLRPLRLSWSDLSDAQKQSWLKRVPRLQQMSEEQLTTAQERMAEWAALSGQQRAQVQERLTNSRQPDPSSRAKLWKDFTGQ